MEKLADYERKNYLYNWNPSLRLLLLFKNGAAKIAKLQYGDGIRLSLKGTYIFIEFPTFSSKFSFNFLITKGSFYGAETFAVENYLVNNQVNDLIKPESSFCPN